MRMDALVLPPWLSSDKKRMKRWIWTERQYGNTLAMIGYCCWWTLWLRVVFVWMMCLSGYACRVPMICGCQINYFMWLMWLCGCCGWKSILLYVCLSPNFPLCIQVGEAWCTKSGKKTGSPTSSAPYMTFCLWPWVKSNLMFVIFIGPRSDHSLPMSVTD